MTEEEILAARFADLADRSYTRARATFTDFLGLAELDILLAAARDFSYVPYALFGGVSHAERVMARFGDEESLGYPPPDYPIACLAITPNAPKFAEPLSHRDILGSLMNLGIKREMLGDIFPAEGVSYLFCHEKIAAYLTESLTRIRHTAVTAAVTALPASLAAPATEQMTLTLASPRLDAIVAHAAGLSRTEAADLIAARRVFLSGRVSEDPARRPREGDILTLRGIGRFRIVGEAGETKKGRVRYLLEKYV